VPDNHETMPPLPLNPDGRRVEENWSGDREESTWKMGSKLMHPSSHVINEFENTLNDLPKNQFFALQILMYGWGIITIFQILFGQLDVSRRLVHLSFPVIGELATRNGFLKPRSD
jgi:hypothetical protein